MPSEPFEIGKVYATEMGHAVVLAITPEGIVAVHTTPEHRTPFLDIHDQDGNSRGLMARRRLTQQ